MKKSAPKSVKKTKKQVSSSSRVIKPKKMSLLETYYHQTDEFFVNHPNSRMLLGIFIVVFAVFLGLLFHDKAQAMGWKNDYHYYYYYY